MVKIIQRSRAMANGERPIALRITKNGFSKVISLGFSCRKEQWKNGEIAKNHPDHIVLNQIILKAKNKALSIIHDFSLEEVDFTLEQFQQRYHGKSKNQISVRQFWEERIKGLISVGDMGNAKVYRETLKSFGEIVDVDKLRFTQITPALIDKYEEHLRKKGWIDSSISQRMRTLRALFNYAIRHEVVDQKYYPFDIFKVSKLKGTGFRQALAIHEFEKFEKFDPSSQPKLIDAHKLFLFSFYTRGMNFVDMVTLKWSDIYNDRIHYTRSKIKKNFVIEILPQVKEILDYYKIRYPESKYVFPIILKDGLTASQIYYRRQKVLKRINRRLKDIAEAEGIETKITFYIARHTFAMFTKMKGMHENVISQALGHNDIKTTKAYLRGFDDEYMDKEIRKVLEEPVQSYDKIDSLSSDRCEMHSEKRTLLQKPLKDVLDNIYFRNVSNCIIKHTMPAFYRNISPRSFVGI